MFSISPTFIGTVVEDNGLGSFFQFENRHVILVRFANQELCLRFMHCSNAGLKQPNDDVETYTLHHRFRFLNRIKMEQLGLATGETAVFSRDSAHALRFAVSTFNHYPQCWA